MLSELGENCFRCSDACAFQLLCDTHHACGCASVLELVLELCTSPLIAAAVNSPTKRSCHCYCNPSDLLNASYAYLRMHAMYTMLCIPTVPILSIYINSLQPGQPGHGSHGAPLQTLQRGFKLVHACLQSLGLN